jgi:hypothetical protein
MRRRRGLSLVEITLALGLLASGFLTVLGVFPVGMSALRQSEGVVLATDLAQKELEALRALPYESLATLPVRTTSVALTASGLDVTRLFTTTVSAGHEPVPGRLREIVVMVTWQDGGQVRYVRMATLVTPSLQ